MPTLGVNRRIEMYQVLCEQAVSGLIGHEDVDVVYYHGEITLEQSVHLHQLIAENWG